MINVPNIKKIRKTSKETLKPTFYKYILQISLKLRKLNSPSCLFQKEAPDIYPESGFEARYERVLIFQDVKEGLFFSLRVMKVRKKVVGKCY